MKVPIQAIMGVRMYGQKLEAKLRTHRELMDRRKLQIPIHAISFAPGVNNQSVSADYPLANATSLLRELEAFTWGGMGKPVPD